MQQRRRVGLGFYFGVRGWCCGRRQQRVAVSLHTHTPCTRDCYLFTKFICVTGQPGFFFASVFGVAGDGSNVLLFTKFLSPSDLAFFSASVLSVAGYGSNMLLFHCTPPPYTRGCYFFTKFFLSPSDLAFFCVRAWCCGRWQQRLAVSLHPTPLYPRTIYLTFFFAFVLGDSIPSRRLLNGAPRVWAEKIYFGHKILMKQPHDCSY